MMKLLILSLLMIGTLADVGLIKSFKPIDLLPILADPKLTDFYDNCALGEGPCNTAGQSYRDGLPSAVQSACGLCNENERIVIRLAMLNTYEERRHVFDKLMVRYDPTGVYRGAFIRFIFSND